MNDVFDKLEETAAWIAARVSLKPTTGIVLGSGLGNLVDRITEQTVIEYRDIPHFPVPTVAGHAGRLVFGKIGGTNVVAMQGRFHFYEGHAMRTIAFPVALMNRIGVSTLVVSNAAGGINRGFKSGDLMIITDHINLFGTNPLIGLNDERLGPRFPDLSDVYSGRLIGIADGAARTLGMKFRRGIYAGLSGPCYETAAEIKYLKAIGADAVGMSTVPEAIVARYLGMETLGVSCITNMATGIAKTRHSHESVMKTANEAAGRFCAVMAACIANF